MNVQPKPSHDDDCTMVPGIPEHSTVAQRRVPSGPRSPLTWPVEFEVEPWRP
ncbi:MAG: hypothetical protein WC876_02185 [Candidatus Thermoplasmatota archaeon]|jgi:hypothetical protein